MPHIFPPLPIVGSPHASEDPKTRNALLAIRDLINGQLDQDNIADGSITANKFADAVAKSLGIKTAAVNGRGAHAVATSQTTTSTSFVDLSTAGPSVSVDVAADGFVLVYADVTLTPPVGAAARVGLYEATDLSTPVPILSRIAGDAPGRMLTRPGSSEGIESRSGPGGFLVVPVTAGTRTFQLRYARGAGSGSAGFANRKLWVIGGSP